VSQYDNLFRELCDYANLFRVPNAALAATIHEAADAVDELRTIKANQYVGGSPAAETKELLKGADRMLKDRVEPSTSRMCSGCGNEKSACACDDECDRGPNSCNHEDASLCCGGGYNANCDCKICHGESCSTCGGTGEIDETLGGIPTSNRHAPCPDCTRKAEECPVHYFDDPTGKCNCSQTTSGEQP
jgi:hypothetical protein